MSNNIPDIVREFAEETRLRIIANLKRRSIVGQRQMVSAITVNITGDAEDVIDIEFVFDIVNQRKRGFYDTKGIYRIPDPLFKRAQVFTQDDTKRAFLRRADIYANITGPYFEELLEKVTAVNAELAARLSIQQINNVTR